ncbi:MAG: putative acyl--CoA ligase YhfT [Candidatus Erwinia impunctatus]|nr:putative acyl--CoA ligase YhfT [Culicoides impunctatus]
MSQVVYQGVALERASGDIAESLTLLVRLYQQQRSFRVLPQLPLVCEQPGSQYIECTTGGSSGTPKIIRRHFRSWQHSFIINQQHFRITSADRYAIFGHINHSLSLYALCEALHLELPIEVLSDMRPRSQKRQLQKSAASVLYVTPTQLRLLVSVEGICPAVRVILCGGSKLDTTLRQQAMACFPAAQLYEFYGASETSFITLSDAGTPSGSVGKAYPGVNITLRNKQDDNGEVWVSSPYLFEGYTQGESSDTRWCDGAVTVGELGYLDAEGYLWLRGRHSRMITTADKNVYPEMIETVISQFTGPVSCAVVAKPDVLRGHVLYAFIEGEKHAVSEAEIRQAVRQQLGNTMEPRHFIYLPALPLLASGKPDLAILFSKLPL